MTCVGSLASALICELGVHERTLCTVSAQMPSGYVQVQAHFSRMEPLCSVYARERTCALR